MRTTALAVLTGIGLSACGGVATFTADPAHYVLRLDQLVTANFSVLMPLRHLDTAGAAYQSAATIEFGREVNFDTANGPLEVSSTVERFAGVDAAAAAYMHDIAARDATGETALSTGPLGDAAHADSLVRDSPAGPQAVEITVEWRTANLVNILVVRGRYGGTRLLDGLTLAHRQSANQTV